MIELTHLRHLALFTDRLEEATKFYEEIWGLDVVHRDEREVLFRGAGDEHHILRLIRSDQCGIHHLGFGMRDKVAIDEAAKELHAIGIETIDGPRWMDAPGGGYALRFADPEGRCIELSCFVEIHQTEWRSKNVDPIQLNHVVLNTADIDAISNFYTNHFNFKVSDWSEHQMVFLRCNKMHHSIAFNQAPHASLNHVAFEVDGVDEVMRGIANTRERGINPMWGPGRHGPGNNVFCYFRDPTGYVIEYTCYLLTLEDDHYQARVWKRIKPLMDRWGIAGPPSSEARQSMQGTPDEGWLRQQSARDV